MIFKMSTILIPIFQYIPCASLWFGIMSIPLLFYFLAFLDYPYMIDFDINFFFGFPGTSLILIGLILFVYSLSYQIIYRKMFIKEGPYRVIRHPQYLGIILMTLGLTIMTFYTQPAKPFDNFIETSSIREEIVIIWILECLAYIILAKIEDFSMNDRYGNKFKEYVHKVPFMIPFLKFRRKKHQNHQTRNVSSKFTIRSTPHIYISEELYPYYRKYCKIWEALFALIYVIMGTVLIFFVFFGKFFTNFPGSTFLFLISGFILLLGCIKTFKIDFKPNNIKLKSILIILIILSLVFSVVIIIFIIFIVFFGKYIILFFVFF